MKRVALFFFAFILALSVQAQKTDTTKRAMKRDCVMMENGKMMVTQKGITKPMDKDMTMSNGTMVMMNGQVKMKNGKSMMLKDGDCVYMNGKVSHMGMKKEKEKM